MKVLLRPCFTDDRRAAWTFCGLDDEGAGILARVAPPSAFAWRDGAYADSLAMARLRL